MQPIHKTEQGKARLNLEIKVAGVGIYESVYELVDASSGKQLEFEVMQHPRKTRKGVLASVKRRAQRKLDELGYELAEWEDEY